MVWTRCSSCNNILDWFIFVTDKIDTGPIHYNWMTGWFIKSGYLILPGPVQFVGSWWSPFQIPPFIHGKGAWPHFYSFWINKVMHDILWCTLWTTPKTQQHFQPGKISVFGAWGRDKLTAAPTTWLLMKLSSGPRPSSVNPQTILSQKTFCIINQTWYWVTWILFTEPGRGPGPGCSRGIEAGAEKWHWDLILGRRIV